MSNQLLVPHVALRFVVTGVAATATYFALTMFLIAPPLRLESVRANATALIVSILVSYVAHHCYTFERKGHHSFYFSRFIAASLTLFVMSNFGMYVFSYVFLTDPRYVAVAITIAYPIASYLLNNALGIQATIIGLA